MDPCGSLIPRSHTHTPVCTLTHSHTDSLHVPVELEPHRSDQSSFLTAPAAPAASSAGEPGIIILQDLLDPARVLPAAKRSQGCGDWLGSHHIRDQDPAAGWGPKPGGCQHPEHPWNAASLSQEPIGLSLHPWGQWPSHQHLLRATSSRSHRQIQPKRDKSHWINAVSRDFPL